MGDMDRNEVQPVIVTDGDCLLFTTKHRFTAEDYEGMVAAWKSKMPHVDIMFMDEVELVAVKRSGSCEICATCAAWLDYGCVMPEPFYVGVCEPNDACHHEPSRWHLA